jgi:hypothetical protein
MIRCSWGAICMPHANMYTNSVYRIDAVHLSLFVSLLNTDVYPFIYIHIMIADLNVIYIVQFLQDDGTNRP